MEARFSGGSGLSRGEARRRRRAWRALDGPEPPEVLRTWERGRGGREASLRRPRGFQRFISFASGCSKPSILGRASRAFWSIAGTISHSVVAFQRPHPDSAFAGGRLGRASPLFATAFQAQQSIGSPTRIDRGWSDLGGFV